MLDADIGSSHARMALADLGGTVLAAQRHQEESVTSWLLGSAR